MESYIMAITGISNNNISSSNNNQSGIKKYIKDTVNDLLFSQNTTKTNAGNTDVILNKKNTYGISKEERTIMLQEKQARTNSLWNKVKNFFGYGEKMSEEEKNELDKLISEKHYDGVLHVEDEYKYQ